MPRLEEYELYVPLVLKDGKRLPAKDLKELKRGLVARFGGLTHFPQKSKGVWRVGNATFYDEIIILRVLAGKTKSNHDYWSKLKARLRKEWRQKHVLVIVRDVGSI